MTRPLTIRTDQATIAHLDAVAERRHRSRNYIANEALKRYLQTIDNEGSTPVSTIPVVTHLEDLSADVWPDEPLDAFLDFLQAERERSLADDAERDLD